MQYGRFPKAADLPSVAADRSVAVRPGRRQVRGCARGNLASQRPRTADPMRQARRGDSFRRFDRWSSKWAIRHFQQVKLAHAASTGWPYFVKSFRFVALFVTVYRKATAMTIRSRYFAVQFRSDGAMGASL